MRILVVGAGAIGGYFGARLVVAGRDVTFLVRSKRAELLAKTGLRVRSPVGDAFVPSAQTVTADRLKAEFDVILLSCKAYDLDAALDDISPAVKAGTIILPLLNGLRHVEVLVQRFPEAVILGGQCVISTTLDEHGTIVHLNSVHSVTFGPRDADGQIAARGVADAFANAGFDVVLSAHIMQAMWNKWIVLASMAGVTSLMRAPLGAINRAPGGTSLIEQLIGEVAAVASREGFEPTGAYLDETRAFLTDRATGQTSSMFRDISNGARIEADHIIGDLLLRSDALGLASPALRTVYTHLKAYELQRAG